MSEYPKVFRNGKLVSKSSLVNEKANGPYVISDEMEPLKHHGTGRMISSKRAFSAETKAAGMVELGNEPIGVRKPVALGRRERREAIRRAIYHLKNGLPVPE